MSLPLLISPEAEADLADARSWYEQQRPGLGDDFLQHVEEAFAAIAQMPQAHQVIHKDVRRRLLTRFPYGVFYRIHDDHVVVVAVMHSRRDPKAWQSRA